MSIRILYCLLLILLPITSIWAIPSDSSEVEKSIKSFLRFVEKNEKSTQKNYLFNYQQINEDNFRQELVNNGTAMFASGIAATHYNELRNYVDNFNNTYNIGNPASTPNSQFEIYIFRGRFFPSISTQIIAKREENTLFGASNSNKLEDLKAKFSIDVDDNIIYDNLSNRVVSALKDQYPNKRVLVVFAVEKHLFEYQNDDEYINDVETPNASKTTLGRSYALNIGWQSVGNVSEINAIGNLIDNLNDNKENDSYLNACKLTNNSDENDLALKALNFTKLLGATLKFPSAVAQIDNIYCSPTSVSTLFGDYATPQTEYVFNKLSIEHKIKLLSSLVSVTFFPGDVNNALNNKKELIALAILRQTPKDRIDALLVELAKPITVCNNANVLNKILIERLMARIDDSHCWIGSNNYTALMKIISSLVQNAEGFQKKLDDLRSDTQFELKNILWNQTEDVGATKIVNFEFDATSATTKYTVKKLERVDVVISGGISSNYGTGSATTTRTKVWETSGTLTTPLNPFDLVLIANLGSLSIINEAITAPITTNSPMSVVPAIFLKYAFDKEGVEFYKGAAITTACIVIDAFTIIKGVPAFSVARGLRAGYIGFEVVNAVGNIALNVNKEAFRGTSFEHLVEASDKIMLFIGAKEILKMGIKKSLPDLFTESIKTTHQLSPEALKTSMALYERFKGRLADMKNINQNAPGLTPKYMSDDEIKAFKESFEQVKKDLLRTPEGTKILQEADDLARSAEDLGKLLGFDELVQKVIVLAEKLKIAQPPNTLPKRIENMVGNCKNAGGDGLLLLQKFASGVYDDIENVKDLLSFITKKGQDIAPILQTLKKADELMLTYPKERMIFEYKVLGQQGINGQPDVLGIDVDLGILKSVGTIGDFEIAIQLKKYAGVNSLRSLDPETFDQVNNAIATNKILILELKTGTKQDFLGNTNAVNKINTLTSRYQSVRVEIIFPNGDKIIHN